MKHPYLLAAFVLAFVLVAVVLWQFDPNQAGNPLPSCPSRWLTGLYCPGCGTTRALHALLHGDIVKAFSMNPVFVLASPIVALLILDQSTRLPQGLTRLARFFSDARPWAWGLIGFAILRNLPWYPFNLLAPG
ncbi:MAG: DUF2752 domain-containing protein [Arenimonas sp.]